MKCQVIRDDQEVSPNYIHHPALEGCTETREVMRNGEMTPVVFLKKGAVIENPDAWKAVRMGWAIPADEDCRMKARMSQQKMDAAQYAYERLQRVNHEDFDLYDAGIIVGYNPDGSGSYLPGPNWDKRAEFFGPETEEGEDDL